MFLGGVFRRVDGGPKSDPVAHGDVDFRFKVILTDPGAVLGCTLAISEVDADGKKQQKKELSHVFIR